MTQDVDQTKKRDWRKRLRTVFVVLTVAALLVIGGSLGRLLLPREYSPLIVEAADTVAGTDQVMPDVVGIDQEVAGFVLADGGISVPIEVTAAPAAGQLGRVLSQDPKPGQPVGDLITLTVSEEWKMPDYVGTPSLEARVEMDRHGAVITESTVLDLSQRPGHVVRTNPPAGETAPQVIEVIVAEEGEGLSLLDVRTEAQGRWSSSSNMSVNGKKMAKAYIGNQRSDEVRGWWVLGRNAASLKATVGVSDAGPTDASGKFIFLGDGEVIGEWEVHYGESVEIEVPLNGVLRMEMIGESGDDVVLVLGEPILRVSTEGAEALTS